MSCIFKWVQLSDIHFQTDTATFNAEALRDSLPEYLNEKVSDCNALILTGDYRYAREPKWDSKAVADYIRKIATNLKVGNNIYAVPGNHDLDRSEERDYLIQGVQNKYKPMDGMIDKQVCSRLLEGFGFFKEICEELKLKSFFDNQEECPHIVIPLTNCSLLLMNTALTAGCDTDSGKLILGTRFVHSVIKMHCDDQKPIIAIGHHSLKELNCDEHDAITKMFDKNMVRLYLCGHAHEHRYRCFGKNGEEATVGCLKQDNNSVMATFAVGELFDDGKVKITSHMWDINEQGWYVDPPRNRIYEGLYSQKNALTTEDPPKAPEMNNNDTKKLQDAEKTDIEERSRDNELTKWDYLKKGNEELEKVAIEATMKNTERGNEELKKRKAALMGIGVSSTTAITAAITVTALSAFPGTLFGLPLLAPALASGFALYFNINKRNKINLHNAIDNYTKAIESDPSFLEAYYGRAYAYRALGMYEEAKDDFLKVIELDSNNAQGYNNIANIYISLKNYFKAIEYSSKAIDLNDSLAVAYQNRAAAYEAIGEMEKAKADKEIAVSIERASANQPIM